MALLTGEQAFQLGLPWSRGPGWNGGAFSGWYVHEGSLYIQGTLQSSGRLDTPSGTLLLSGLPADLQPAETLEFTVPLLCPDPATPGLVLPTTAVLVVDGPTVSLSELPPWINAVPNYQYDQWAIGVGDHMLPVFSGPLVYGIALSTLNWPLRVRTLKAKPPPWESLAPYLGDAFENIDGQIRLWKSRVDIKGSVRAVRNIANSIFMPDGGWTYSAITPMLVNLPPDIAAGLLGQTGTTVVYKGDVPIWCTFQGNAGGQNLLDGEAFDQSSVGSSSVMLFPYNDVRMLGILYNPDWPGGLRVAAPMDDWVPDLATLFDPNTRWPAGQFWSPVAEVSPFAGGGLGNPTYYWHYSAAPGDALNMESSVGGLDTHPGAIVNDGWGGSPWGPGGRRIQRQPTWQWNNNTGALPANSDGRVKLASLDISDAVDAFDPQPDYVALCIAIGGSAAGGFGATSIKRVGLEGVSDFVLSDNRGTIIPYNSASNPSSGSIGALTNSTTFIVAWVAPPNFSAVYGDDPHNPASKFLWEFGSLPTVFTPYADWHTDTPLFTGQWAQVNFDIWVIPFWRTRRNWILKDDILTLDGGGWQSAWTPPALPTTVIPGLRTVGLVNKDHD